MIFDLLHGTRILHVIKVNGCFAKNIFVQSVKRRILNIPTVFVSNILTMYHLIKWTKSPVLIRRFFWLWLVVRHIIWYSAIVTSLRNFRRSSWWLIRFNSLIWMYKSILHIFVRVAFIHCWNWCISEWSRLTARSNFQFYKIKGFHWLTFS